MLAVTEKKGRPADERNLKVSFEFFPPKTAKMEESLWRCIRRLEPLAPHFVSVTYGAGGSTRDRTHATLARVLSETALAPAAHLTCVAATREEVDAVIRDYAEAVVDGEYAGNGVFTGTALQAKCASKYERELEAGVISESTELTPED